MKANHEFSCEDCNATGYIEDIVIVRRCCGSPLPSGECCGDAIGVEEPQVYKCEYCNGTGDKRMASRRDK